MEAHAIMTALSVNANKRGLDFEGMQVSYRCRERGQGRRVGWGWQLDARVICLNDD